MWVVGATWTILQQRRAPAATLSWIFAFVALPFVSGLYYIVFGPRRLHRRRIRYGIARRSIAGQIQEYIRNSACQGEAAALRGRRGHGEGGLAPGPGRSHVRHVGEAARHRRQLPLGARARDARRRSTTSTASTTSGSPTRSARVSATCWRRPRGRGVEVRVVIDAVGSRAANDALLEAAGRCGRRGARASTRCGSRSGSLNFANFRTHRKIVVIDGNVGFLGGKNLHDPVSATASGKGAWRDMHARIDGEPVRRLQRLFVENWIYAGGKFVLDLENVKQLLPPGARAARQGGADPRLRARRRPRTRSTPSSSRRSPPRAIACGSPRRTSSPTSRSSPRCASRCCAAWTCS